MIAGAHSCLKGMRSARELSETLYYTQDDGFRL